MCDECKVMRRAVTICEVSAAATRCYPSLRGGHRGTPPRPTACLVHCNSVSQKTLYRISERDVIGQL